MADIVNDRDLQLQVTSPRIIKLASDYLTLVTSSNVFKITNTGIKTPSTITVTPQFNGSLRGTIVWTRSPEVGTIDPITQVLSIPASSINAGDNIAITATVQYNGNSYIATANITTVLDGTDSLQATLSAETISLTAGLDGTVVGGALPLTVMMQVFRGTTALTSGVRYDLTTNSGLNSTMNTNTGEITVTGVTADVGYATYTATIGTTVLTKRLTISKSRQGSQGISIAGADGRRSATGYVYYSSSTDSPSNPTADSYMFNTARWSGGNVNNNVSNFSANTWNKGAPTYAAGNNNKYWAAPYTVIEDVGSPGYASGANISFGAPTQTIGFSGLVTFSGSTVTDGTNTLSGFTSQTQINGNQITTGTVATNVLEIANNTSANRIVLTNDNIQVYQASVLRVKIGKLI